MALPSANLAPGNRMQWVGATVGAFLGSYIAWWLAGAGASLYSPYAKSADHLDTAALVSLAGSAAVLCPLLGWVGRRIGLLLGSGRAAPAR